MYDLVHKQGHIFTFVGIKVLLLAYIKPKISTICLLSLSFATPYIFLFSFVYFFQHPLN